MWKYTFYKTFLYKKEIPRGSIAGLFTTCKAKI
jgi:hypothetical protein